MATLAPIGERPLLVATLLLVVFAALLAQAYFRPFTADLTVDSYSYYYGAKALAEGLDPYDTEVIQELAPKRLGFVFPYLYPPLLAMMWRPLLALSPESAHDVTVFLSGLLAILNVGLIWRLARPSTRAAGWLVVFILAQLVCGPLISTLRLGQVNTLVVTLVLSALLFERDGEPILTGFLLALAILLKVTPFVFLVDFVLRRRWRSLFSTLFFTGGIAGATSLWTGVGPWIAFAKRTLEPLPFHPPMSLDGLLAAVGRSIGLPRPFVLIIVIAGLTVLLVRLAIRLPALREEYGSPVAGWCMLIFFSLLAFPLTWHHHYYLTLLPFAYFVFRADSGVTKASLAIWLFLAAAVLLRYPGDLHPIKPIAALIAFLLI